ncbi:MAG TPA: NAD-dependent epimerase/dehydratase family protein [Xanthobacteraceae bacterium]|nr:NAD-dependent epimerase/dehydratase family protein [Xanthobacteraceae bacterium]
MSSLLCLGLGYCATRFTALAGGAFTRIVGTTRTPPEDPVVDDVELMLFDGPPSAELRTVAADADMLLISAAPDAQGCPVLARLGGDLAGAAGCGPIVYLSTIGVYGDSGGGWIDETAPLAAHLDRARRRIEAEAAWVALGQATGRPVAVLRLGGIYGPGRNALADVAAGEARCIVKPGQVFNRIHVDDIAAAIATALACGYAGAVNVVDDEPAPAAAPVEFAAGLLGLAPPPPVPFAQAVAAMSPMARTFWADNRRVRNHRLRFELGVELAYPTYREGLSALFEAGEGAPA